MAKKEKKISVSALEEVVKNGFDNKVVENWHGIDIQITKNISLVSAAGFVQEVVGACVENNAAFEIKDLLIKKNIIERYTNLSLPAGLERIYEIVYGCDIIPYLMQYINEEQLSDIIYSIDKKLAYKLSSNIYNIEKEVGEVVSRTNELMDSIERVFSSFSPEDIKRVSDIINNENIDENNIIKSIIDISKSGDSK